MNKIKLLRALTLGYGTYIMVRIPMRVPIEYYSFWKQLAIVGGALTLLAIIETFRKGN